MNSVFIIILNLLITKLRERLKEETFTNGSKMNFSLVLTLVGLSLFGMNDSLSLSLSLSLKKIKNKDRFLKNEIRRQQKYQLIEKE